MQSKQAATRPAPEDETAGRQYDVVVVGARCAGATAATVLARAGRRVLLVDRDRFPSDTVSTHQLFPDALQLLDHLGVGERLRAGHWLRPVRYSWRVLGHDVAGGFTAVGGYDRTCSVRRVTLDAVLVETALAAGAESRFGAEVRGLLGTGTETDPVRGVVLSDGETLTARWVVGADGRASTVARRLGLKDAERRRGEMSMLFAYWAGLPESDWCQIDVHEQLALMSAPCEDGLHLLSVNGPATFTRGSRASREEVYRSALRRFPATLNPRLLQRGRRVSPVVTVPETMLRGFVRQAYGPGWALIGDAGLFKHPVTAQGIGDALAAGHYVGQALAAGSDLSEYPDWRAERAADHYDFSFETARFPTANAAALYSGLAGDPAASQEFLDMFARRHRPREVLTSDRIGRWRAAFAYEEGLREVSELLESLPDEALAAPVPACPAWTVGDLIAHLVGVAEDSARGAYFAQAMEAWQVPAYADAREAWTAGHLRRHPVRSRDALLCGLDRYGRQLVQDLRTGGEPASAGPPWMTAAPAADLSVHVADLREALGKPSDLRGFAARTGFGAYRAWLHQRLRQQTRPALVLADGQREWQVGEGRPAGRVTTSGYELFRMITGRRSPAQIGQYDWTTDPAPYLAVLAPYPLPG